MTTAVVHFGRYQMQYSVHGKCTGSEPVFAEYLATADGQAELQKLQARAEKQAREELQAHPSELD